ncbi:hypothetical protein BKA56DRAFT_576403 [Ilyonectria sp. MPI-CAGE-AT-0026]|nr:hypothetical protein BKA56DRAFT_576403 [Ilyonectria sp. MPI-CAGE-AT-0026]
MADNNAPQQPRTSKSRAQEGAWKRAQNRLSQQCRRERKSAQGRHLEHALATLQTTANLQGEDRYSVLLQTYLKLLDEHQALQDATLRLRKRLLSVSNAAAAAAEDPFFETLLKKNGKRDATTSTVDDSPEPTIQPVATVTHNDESLFLSEPGFEPMFSNPVDHHASDPGSSLLGQISTPMLVNPVPAFFHFPLEFGFQNVYVQSPTEFADKTMSACRQYLNVALNVESANWSLPLQELLNQQSNEVAAAAVRLLSRCAGIEPYVYGIGRADYLEKIIRWRLSNSPDDAADIPPQFAPTQLQHRQNNGTLQHHLLIDFICWPEIRDQVILHTSELDLDMLQRDIVFNTVIEVPRYGLALGVLDLFQNWICARGDRCQEGPASYLGDRNWVFFTATEEADSLCLGNEVVEKAILQELTSIVHQHSTSALEPRTITQPTMDLVCDFATRSSIQDSSSSWKDIFGKYRVAMNPRTLETGAMGCLELQETHYWKLGKDFARKYTILDCSSGESRLTPSYYLAKDCFSYRLFLHNI